MRGTLRIQDVRELRKSVLSGSPTAEQLIEKAIQRPIRSPGVLRELQDLSLFMEAYPGNARQQALADCLQDAIRQWVVTRNASDAKAGEGLRDSGITGCDCVGSYSLSLVRWLLRTWPGQVELFSMDALLEEAAALLRPLLPAAEREAIDLPMDDASELASALFGESPLAQLMGLVELLDGAVPDDGLREGLFARLQVFIRIDGGARGFSLTEVRGEPKATYLHADGLLRSVDVRSVLTAPVGAPIKLHAKEAAAVIHSARTALALMQRETDPVTYAHAVELFDMGRGLRIALFHLDAEHRLVLESYVGFMAFKNGVPMAYGGAWVFPGRTKVGINVFPALRGGESAWFFAQLLRLYRQRFGVHRFEAENYQLGHNNPDGLKSGAYWFYYRLGFRPAERTVQRMAEREYNRLSARKGYQTPTKLLKKLVEQGLELVIGESDAPLIDTAALIVAMQRHVVKRYNGNRRLAMRRALERMGNALPLSDLAEWSPEERIGLYLWALPLDMIEDLEAWPSGERKRLVALIKAKAKTTETAHQAALAKHRRLMRAWHALAAV